jgi:hypothetical protein
VLKSTQAYDAPDWFPNMPFVPNDPPEFLTYNSMKEVLAYHEAGHLFFAYYYGYEIGMFRFWENMTDVFGSVRNRRIENPPEKDTLESLTFETCKLLAGEIAARIGMKLPLADFCLPVNSPDCTTVTVDTPFADLKYVVNGGMNHDGIKLLELYRKNQGTTVDTWWTWFWKRHAEVAALLREHWDIVDALAERLCRVKANEFDPRMGAMQGYCPGSIMIEWCEEVGAPRLLPELKSVSY